MKRALRPIISSLKGQIVQFYPFLATSLAIGLAFVCLFLTGSTTGNGVSFIPLAFVSIIAVIYGFPYGVLATLISIVLEIYTVIPPHFYWVIPNPTDRLRLTTFTILSFVVSWVGGRASAERNRASAAENRQRLLAEISYVLAESLEYNCTLTRITELLVPRFADVCVLHILNKDGQPPAVKYKCGDPEKQPLVHELVHNYLSDLEGPTVIAKVVRERRAYLSAKPSKKWFHTLPKDKRHEQLLRDLAGQSLICVPIIAHGHVLGGLTFATFRRDKPYRASDAIFCDEVAKRCAAAIFSAQLYADANNALQAREEFISIASHELKTPLTPLYLRLQTLSLLIKQHQKDASLVITKDLSPTVEACLDQTKRLVRLVDDLLDLSRIRLGKIILERSHVDLCEVVEQTAAQMAASQPRPRVSIRCQNRIVGNWDRRRIEQVVINLLSNAIKYGEGSPIDITIDAPTPDSAVLQVRDGGIGISAELKARIFERFERGVNPSRLTGLGLGLYITRQIVEAHEGKIEVESEVGKGSVFIVRLPTQIFKSESYDQSTK